MLGEIHLEKNSRQIYRLFALALQHLRRP